MANKFLRRREVLKRAGFSNTTLWREERAGRFPRRHALSPGLVGWLESEVEAWIAERAAADESEAA